MKNDLGYEGKVLSTPYSKDDVYNSLSMPIYNSMAFEFNTASEMEKAFCGKTSDHTYSRVSNPTVQYFEDRVKNITGAYGVTALNSGMAAISNTFFALAWSGCNIIVSPHLFGNTYSFFTNTLTSFGVEIRFCDLTNIEEVASKIDKNTCGIFVEIITNPQMEVADLKALSIVAHKNNVPLIVDSTIIPFPIFKGSEFGVDIEVISSTKYISGGATSLGGIIIDYGLFDWSNSKKLSSICNDSPSAFHMKLRKEIHRNLGAYMTPQTAYMQTIGLETLSLRFNKQSSTCLELAERLNFLPQIKNVNYTGLRNNLFFEISRKQFGELPGAMMTFSLDSKDTCFNCIDRVKLFRRATNLFDNKSLIIHPASTIYGSFSQEQRDAMDIDDSVIRLSIGLESANDLYNDILQALNSK